MRLLDVLRCSPLNIIDVLTLLVCLLFKYNFFLQRLSNLLLKFLVECMSAVAI